jgi:4-hydroxybenzoate polyprenyltransferase
MDGTVIINLLLTPPLAFIIFFGLISLGYYVIRKYSAKGPDHPDKHLPYSGGQKIPPVEVRLSYNTYFRIALLFGITHVAVLVLATLPLGEGRSILGLLFLIGISISAVVLARRKPD